MQVTFQVLVQNCLISKVPVKAYQMNFNATARLIFPHVSCTGPHCQSSVTNCNISALSVITLVRVTKDSVEC